jgi:hypothetical protein
MVKVCRGLSFRIALAFLCFASLLGSGASGCFSSTDNPKRQFPPILFDAGFMAPEQPDATTHDAVTPEASAPDVPSEDVSVADVAPDSPPDVSDGGPPDVANVQDAPAEVAAAPAVFTVTPNSYDFGSVTVGTSSAAKSFTVTNTGGTASGVPSIAASGTNAADFAITTNSCSAALNPTATCSFSVVFTASTPAPESGTITASATSTTSGATSLTGTGLAPAALAIAPAGNNFGSVIQGGQSSDLSFTVTNMGGVASGALSVALTGGSANQFQLGTDGCTGVMLAANSGSSCTVKVHFKPTAPTAGAVQASLTISSSPGGTATASLSGTALTPASLSVTDASGQNPYNYGSIVQGNATSPVVFTVSNSGGVASGVPTVTVGGANAGDFQVASNTCTAAVGPNGGQCQIGVTFKPSTTASESATLTVSASPGGAPQMGLQGTGLAPAALAVSPAAGHDFGSVTQGGQSADFPFTVTNSGGVASGTLSVALTGGSANQFQLGTDTCAGATLAANGGTSCTVNVHFQPTASTTGAVQATLTITGTPGGTTTATVSGTALTPAALSITDANGQNPYNYGSILQGVNSAVVTFTVTNSGGSASGVPTVGISGANSGDFLLGTNACTAGLAANGGQCQVGISFKPSTSSTESATVTVSASPGGAPQIGLTGTGVAPVPSITLSPTAWQTQAVLGSTTPPSQQFTVTNNGTGPTNALSIAGLPANGFAIVSGSDACTAKTLAAGGGVCTFSVSFQPGPNDTPGQQVSATLTVTDSASDQKSANLTGVVLSSTYYLIITPNPANWGTLAPGKSYPMTFTVTNYGAQAAPAIGGFAVMGAPNDPFFTNSNVNCAGNALGAYGSGADACTTTETLAPPVGAAGSLPTGTTLQALGPTGGPIANQAPATLTATW